MSCRANWSPAQRVDLDEAIAPFRGRYRWRVRIIGKPKTPGLKYFTLTDEQHFIYAFRRYAGQRMSVVETVVEFLEKLPHTGHILYADKWFGGLDTANAALSRGHRFTLSCKKTRPTQLWTRLHARLRGSDLATEATDDPRVFACLGLIAPKPSQRLSISYRPDMVLKKRHARLQLKVKMSSCPPWSRTIELGKVLVTSPTRALRSTPSIIDNANGLMLVSHSFSMLLCIMLGSSTKIIRGRQTSCSILRGAASNTSYLWLSWTDLFPLPTSLLAGPLSIIALIVTTKQRRE